MIFLFIIIGFALIFDVINGFHDAANAIATIVTTRVLTASQAVVWAAFFNFIAYLVFGLHVADTIAKGIVQTDAVTLPIILSGLLAAISWNLVAGHSFQFVAHVNWWLYWGSHCTRRMAGNYLFRSV